MDSLPSENDGRHIGKIIDSVGCARHASDIGDACWNILSVRGPLRAICNGRARAAGARGQVTPYTRTNAGNPTNKYNKYNKKDYR